MNASHDVAMILAQPAHAWGAGGGGWWPLLGVLWLALVVTAIWLVARGFRRREPSGLDRAKEILAERFARGELTADEYQERLGQLQ